MNEILAQRLKKLREELGYTQIQVAIYCDLTENAYQNYELQRREPKLSIISRIAEFYDVSIDYLVGRTNNKEVNKEK